MAQAAAAALVPVDGDASDSADGHSGAHEEAAAEGSVVDAEWRAKLAAEKTANKQRLHEQEQQRARLVGDLQVGLASRFLVVSQAPAIVQRASGKPKLGAVPVACC